jgi:hypothetical protein
MRTSSGALLFSTFLVLAPSAGTAPTEGTPGWLEVEYGPLVDLDRLAQSGESVRSLLRELGGRPLGTPDDARVFAIHRLLEPVLERYAFLLSDAVDTVEPAAAAPWVEVAALWERGEAQPAWVDLLRSRKYVLESDGAGRVRAFVPVSGSGAPVSKAAAERAWGEAWPVLRHPLAAERRRLARKGAGEVPALEVTVHAYRHRPEATAFDLGVDPYRTRVESTAPSPGRPPFDLEGLRRALSTPVRIEGGRIEEDGSVRWLVSEAPAAPTLLGAPLDLSDAAVAYRATFHGGLAEPYMSLDKGASPWSAAVGFGGRLRDTALGAVSLLADVRFKTLSVGVDPLADRDLREELRPRLPDFRTHLERFASDASSASVLGQQTRFWFYPDEVEFVLSPGADLFAIRKGRMAAASERVRLGERRTGDGEDPPWTRETVAFINREYETLARVFPEMADLDRTVRLLSAFAWLRAAGEEGIVLPDLDALLAIELPAIPTPRTFPQLLTRDLLPPIGGSGAVAVLDQSWIGEALERLEPRVGRASPLRRLARALDLLDPRDPEQAGAAEEIRREMPAAAGDVVAENALADRALRIAMHRRVLAFAPAVSGDRRVFSVGIGGIDLGTRAAFTRASRGASRLGGGRARDGATAPSDLPAAGGVPAASPTARPDDPPGLPATEMPDHGLGEVPSAPILNGVTLFERTTSRHRFARGVYAIAPGKAVSWTESRLGSDGPEVVSRRRVQEPDGRPAAFLRVEEGRLLPYRLVREGNRLRPVVAFPEIPAAIFEAPRTPVEGGALPAGVVVLEILPQGDEAGSIAVGPGVEPEEPRTIALRRRTSDGRDLTAAVPRAILKRLVLGPRLDPSGASPLPVFGNPAPLLEGAGTLLVLLPDALARSPWAGPVEPVPGEEDPARIVAALGALWNGSGAAVGTDRARSAARWAAAPRAAAGVRVVATLEGFPRPFAYLRDELVRVLPEGRAVAEVPVEGSLVIVTSAEAPGVLAARLRELARSPAMKGRLLAVCSFGGPLRPDLPGRLLEEGNLAGIALLEPSLPAGRGAARAIGAWIGALDAAGPERRVETVPGPFVWYF